MTIPEQSTSCIIIALIGTLLVAPTRKRCFIRVQPTLERKRERNNKNDGFDLFAEEITKAVGTLKSLEWEDIRAERFNPVSYTHLTLPTNREV